MESIREKMPLPEEPGEESGWFLSHAEQQIHDANQHTLTEHLLNVIYSFNHKHSLSISSVLDSGSESDSVWALKAHDLLLGWWRGVVDSCTNIISTVSLV